MHHDALTSLLRHLGLSAGIFVHAEFCGNWAVDTSGQRPVSFHLIQDGHCWLHVEGERPHALRPGDLVVFPRDGRHVVSDGPETPAEDEVNTALPAGDRLPDNRMLCGYFDFESTSARLLLDCLPDVVIVERGGQGTDGLISLIFHELNHPSMGADAIVDYFAHALFVHVLRAAEATGFATGLLKAFRDERLARALAAMHSEPGADWNLETLAAEARMGRSSFAQHFRDAVGQTPARYLKEWRLQIARELLRDTRLSVAEIAERSGYDSEPAFRKAFSQFTGEPPGAVRRAARDG